jgi:hypothetical protein
MLQKKDSAKKRYEVLGQRATAEVMTTIGMGKFDDSQDDVESLQLDHSNAFGMCVRDNCACGGNS